MGYNSSHKYRYTEAQKRRIRESEENPLSAWELLKWAVGAGINAMTKPPSKPVVEDTLYDDIARKTDDILANIDKYRDGMLGKDTK